MLQIFYKGLEEKFIKRDNMYFLSDQVNEYDTIRIKTDVEDVQISMHVADEKNRNTVALSAIKRT